MLFETQNIRFNFNGGTPDRVSKFSNWSTKSLDSGMSGTLQGSINLSVLLTLVSFFKFNKNLDNLISGSKKKFALS